MNVKPGDIVFIERFPDDKGSDGKPLSNYDAGEYTVISSGVTTAQLVKGGSGVYDWHNGKNVCDRGPDRWNVQVVSPASNNGRNLQDTLRIIEEEIRAVRSGAKRPQWADSVYSSADANLKAVRRSIGIDPEPAPPANAIPRYGRFLLENGVLSPLPKHATVNITIPPLPQA